MKQIRNSVFETNSSSMHSLVIRDVDLIDGDKYFTSEEIQEEFKRANIVNGVWKDWDNEWYFGRAPFQILSSFKDKWKYAYASLIYDDDSKKETEEELLGYLKEAVPQIKEFKKPEYRGTDECFLSGWLQRNNISLRDFLFNKQYVVICDGDEYCIWESLEKSGLINLDKMTDPDECIEEELD